MLESRDLCLKTAICARAAIKDQRVSHLKKSHKVARDSCSIDPAKIVLSFRLGKTRDKACPIKVVLTSEDAKWELIKRINGNKENKKNGLFSNLHRSN